MSKSVNVNRLHVLHLVCFNSSHFPPTPPPFLKSYRVCDYSFATQFLMWLRKRGWTSTSFWNGPSGPVSHRVMCSPNNETVHFYHHIPNKYFLYISYWRLLCELSFCNLPLRPTGLWENFFWLQFQNQYLKKQSCIFLFRGLWGHLVLSVVILSAY